MWGTERHRPADEPLRAAAARRWRVAAAGAAAARVVALLLLLALFAGGLHWSPRYTQAAPTRLHRLEPSSGGGSGASRGGVLSFAVCGNFAAQRVALLSGLVLAAELNRTLVLPRLLRGGGAEVHFGEVYDVASFVAVARAQGVRTVASPPVGPAVEAQLHQLYNALAVLSSNHASSPHLRLSCPAFRVPPELVVKHERLVFAALDALRLSQRLQDAVGRVVRRVQQGSDAGYSVLRLQAGRGWLEQCATWQGNGYAPDNCMNNTDSVGEQLKLHSVDKEVPLLLDTGGPPADPELVQRATSSLAAHGYTVVRWKDLVAADSALPSLPEEEAGLVAFYLALGAHQFVGNSVSLPDALLIMERWRGGRYATYYNGGNIPLEAFMPLFPMPWVFTYNDWSAGTEYDRMVEVAVTSGIRTGRMKPFCLFGGATESPMYQWLRAHGVHIIRHEPAWKEALIAEGRRFREYYTEHYSHLYGSDGALVGAFQRIDLPLLPDLSQYNYVLFTDCDVYFRKQIRLIDWGMPLPTALGLGFENDDKFPYNDGVMLWHMPYMRKTNQAFVDWILAQKNGLYFLGYGPVDQGAFNQYYEKEVKGKPMDKAFNTKMYHPFRPATRIVHLHGPKINHYLQYMESGQCGRFGGLCEQGYRYGGVCAHAAEYAALAPDWQVAVQLDGLCRKLQAGEWRWPWGGPEADLWGTAPS